MTDLRSQNKLKRRERILGEARRLIARQGFDALNLRDLAGSAGISVPTIYNLIGCKEQLLKELTLGTFADFEERLQRRQPVPVVELPATMIDTLMEMIAADENYFRATFLANERIEDGQERHGDPGYRRAPLRQLGHKLFDEAKRQGLLRGEIPAQCLVEQVLACHERAAHDWAHRVIALDEFRAGSLRGFYIALAADAVDAFRRELVARLQGLPKWRA